MYVNVHVEVTNFESLKELFRSALVDEFSPKTGISFSDSILKMHLFFEETPPKSSIYSLCDCGTITYLEYNYNAASIESANEGSQTECPPSNVAQPEKGKEEPVHKEAKPAETNTEQVKPAPTETNIEQVEPKPVESKKTAPSTRRMSKKKECVDLPAIEQLAKDSASKDEYLDKVYEFTGIKGDRANMFKHIVDIFDSLDRPSWNEIIDILKERGFTCNAYDKRFFTQGVQESANTSFWKFIATVCHYMSYINANLGSQPETVSVQEEEAEAGPMFACMPVAVESESAEKLHDIENRLRNIKADTVEEEVTSATEILTKLCPNLFSTTDKVEQLNRSTILSLSKEEVTFDPEVLLDHSESDFEEKSKELHFCQLSWASIARELAKLYDPDSQVEIKATVFLGEVHKLLSSNK